MVAVATSPSVRMTKIKTMDCSYNLNNIHKLITFHKYHCYTIYQFCELLNYN